MSGTQRLSLTATLLVLAACSSETTATNDSGASDLAGGAHGVAGSAASGGSIANGGGVAAGGSDATGGSGSPGGSAATGTGGATSAGGGTSGSGGSSAAGGAGGAGPGVGDSGTDSSTASTPDAGASTSCKRGIAANTAPGAGFFPGVTWWYNWAMQGAAAGAGIEFVPMMWGSGSVGGTIPAGSKYLLTFNEPNFHAQSNLTASEAASYWPTIEAKAAAANVPIVSPALNYCGPASSCNGTSPYQYLRDFFAACQGCKVDYVAVHWYNCDLPSLRDYLEPGGGLEGFEQFGKPIWLTEFSCDGGASVAEQEAFMRAAIPYLEDKSTVFRYSWFSAGPIPNAKLIDDDGLPTALGQVYAGLPQSCQ